MTKTLYIYLSRDLAKVTLMALVILTLVMTVLGVAEPLRKLGLSGMQVLSLFGYTIPVMVSLTLPIAALLAGTLVYGRFSQNNELLAAKASGVSPIVLLRPALALGFLVTILSLVLSNYVTPSLTKRGAQSALDNVEGLVFQQLRAKNYIRKGKAQQYVHATQTNIAQKQMQGVVAVDISNINDVRFLIAPRARIRFDSINGETVATIELEEAVAARTSDYGLMRVRTIGLESITLPSMSKEKEDASWYDLDELVATLRDPTRSERIRTVLMNIRRRGCAEALAGRIIKAINSGEDYSLTDGEYDYVISAGGTETGKEGVVKLLSRGAMQGVRVSVFRSGDLRKTIDAESGKIISQWSTWSKAMEVSLELGGLVSVRVGGAETAEVQQRGAWSVGSLKMPDDIAQKFSGDNLRDVNENPGAYTSDPGLLNSRLYQLKKLAGQIKAEMHVRAAYSLSCCLMVAMGAALGLMFRGGQLLSAFGIAMAPALLVIVMIVMGKGMVSNQDSSATMGFISIWGGLALLVVGNLYIYARLARR